MQIKISNGSKLAAGAVAVLAPVAAQAAPIHFHFDTPVGYSGASFDLNDDGVNDLSFNSSGNGPFMFIDGASISGGAFVKSQNPYAASDYDGEYAARLNAGDIVGFGSTFTSGGDALLSTKQPSAETKYPGDVFGDFSFGGNDAQYLGFRIDFNDFGPAARGLALLPSDASGVHYGYVTFNGDLDITDIAIEDEADADIAVDVPEPATLALFASGAIGMAALRRRQRARAWG